jgi:HEAT repeat protein
LNLHADPQVRFGVAFGLSREEDPLAIQALIDLSSDEDDEVRDWATFALGTQTDLDSPQIREALFKRAVDPNDNSNAPGEGLVGLARRRHEQAFDLILRALQSGRAGTLVFEAAETLADPRLYRALIKLQDDPDYDDYERHRLEDAIAACTHPT